MPQITTPLLIIATAIAFISAFIGFVLGWIQCSAYHERMYRRDKIKIMKNHYPENGKEIFPDIGCDRPHSSQLDVRRISTGELNQMEIESKRLNEQNQK